MSEKRLRELPGKSSRDHLLQVLDSDDFRTKRLLSLETLEARCGSRLRQFRRAETCLGTFDVVRIAQSEFCLVVGPEVARRWLAVCGSAVPSSTGRFLNETLPLFARTLGFPMSGRVEGSDVCRGKCTKSKSNRLRSDSPSVRSTSNIEMLNLSCFLGVFERCALMGD